MTVPPAPLSLKAIVSVDVPPPLTSTPVIAPLISIMLLSAVVVIAKAPVDLNAPVFAGSIVIFPFDWIVTPALLSLVVMSPAEVIVVGPPPNI